MSSSEARRPSIIVVSGPSGAGKSTVLAEVLRQLDQIRFSVSHTTRAPRPGETDGVQYHFVERPTFESLLAAGQFLEWAEVHGHLYGTGRSEYEKAEREGVDLLLDLDVKGAAQVRVQFPDALTVFILPPSYEALERRLRNRGPDDEAALQRRLQAAGMELSWYREYDYSIVNDDLDQSVENLKSLIRAARCRTSRLNRPLEGILGTFKVD